MNLEIFTPPPATPPKRYSLNLSQEEFDTIYEFAVTTRSYGRLSSLKEAATRFVELTRENLCFSKGTTNCAKESFL